MNGDTTHIKLAAKQVIESLDIETYQARKAVYVALENIILFDKKQKDYGPYNICGNPHPQLGVAFRAGDKVNRLLNLFVSDNGGKTPANETIDDSWSDMANYGLIGQLLAREEWLPRNGDTGIPPI